MKNKELSVLNINISGFENCQSAFPEEISLLTWLSSDKYRSKVEQLRTFQDEELQNVMKKSLPAITPCGVFSYRDTEHLIKHSGFLVFDIDFKDNQDIKNFGDLREQISHISSVAYCGLSVRGKGFWGLVPIPKSTPEVHRQRFSALAKDFKDFGINLDKSGSDVCRLRIYSWDSNSYFNHSAKLYTKLPITQPKSYCRPVNSDNRNKVESIVSQIKERKIDITEDYKDGWLKIASSLSNEFGEAGRGYFRSISMFYPKYTLTETDRMYDGCLKHNYNSVTIASFFQIALDHGINIKSEPLITLSASTTTSVSIPIKGAQSSSFPKIGLWDHDIIELDLFFKTVILPLEPIKLNQCTTITDISIFVESHLGFVKANNGNRIYLPYLERLKELKNYLNLINITKLNVN
jgi:hypothetical protein